MHNVFGMQSFAALRRRMNHGSDGHRVPAAMCRLGDKTPSNAAGQGGTSSMAFSTPGWLRSPLKGFVFPSEKCVTDGCR